MQIKLPLIIVLKLGTLRSLIVNTYNAIEFGYKYMKYRLNVRK